MSANFSARASRSGSISLCRAARSSASSRFAFHFSAGSPAQTMRSKPFPRMPSMLRESYFSSKCACDARLAPTNPAFPMSADAIAHCYSPPVPDARGTILVVDDEQANLDSLERIFSREGYGWLLAARGPRAVEPLRSEPVDVILTDLMMPGMSGQELLRAVLAVAPDAEVVLMTAYGTVEAAVAAMKDGAYDFLTKPLKRHAVLKSVAQALEKRKLVQENKQLRARLARART